MVTVAETENLRINTSRVPTSKLIDAIRFVQRKFLIGLNKRVFVDVAFVGNTSEIYTWNPGLIVDIDICCLVRQRNLKVGTWLLKLRKSLKKYFSKRNMEFDLRVIRGPYKPTPLIIKKPFIFVHVAVLTQGEYVRQPLTLQYSWRKYSCIKDRNKFQKIGNIKPNRDVIRSEVERKLSRIRGGVVSMTDWQLPDFCPVELHFTANQPMFAEYCINAALCCSRNHARALGRLEPDTLPNDRFVHWYRKSIIRSSALPNLLRLKERARIEGYAKSSRPAARLAIEYLSELRNHLIGKRSGRKYQVLRARG